MPSLSGSSCQQRSCKEQVGRSHQHRKRQQGKARPPFSMNPPDSTCQPLRYIPACLMCRRYRNSLQGMMHQRAKKCLQDNIRQRTHDNPAARMHPRHMPCPLDTKLATRYLRGSRSRARHRKGKGRQCLLGILCQQDTQSPLHLTSRPDNSVQELQCTAVGPMAHLGRSNPTGKEFLALHLCPLDSMSQDLRRMTREVQLRQHNIGRQDKYLQLDLLWSQDSSAQDLQCMATDLGLRRGNMIQVDSPR
mmetsp:Transcript_4983/g.15654  ORF Transcript_4983/g.15654 Transcript_4983/m.15654 type:complete len:248 (-) Transcript_4983:748-1491(-)